ncbi:hypothetical protein L202_07324 [Cryptococcus amylolentus CBS 6039]|uniref:Dihydrolipoamide acetyltransferase component of pyruvate dehydrogenase complex n=2 Tax=Cryptococcus amylolentus TaxID=104669 RepID=A0A1E3HDH8_9TREE|nr:hypothetical protein L202_07324 [Cryptococcus amylolentus CBS 6039]ODN73796.1 hypothetical protein L202_07324 [Cryptococcus amylolentus CBS 6039]ODO00336.1 hypothetical protein I350_06971 [Cryptococcus amylolentus CBS 6273]
MLRFSQFCIGRRPGCHTRLPIVRSHLRPSAAARIPIPRNPPPPVRRLFHTTPILFGSSPFNLHDVGEGIVEVEIIKWHVKEGQEVEEFDALVEVQSDKSVVELTSHAKGKVRSINGEIGQMIKVGQTLCVIETDDPVEEAHDDGASPIPDQVNREVDAAGQEQESGEEYIKSHESPAVAEAEELSEQLERAPEPHPSSPHKPSKPPRKHPLHESPSHEYLLQGQDAAMDASGPAQLSGEAAILPSAPRPSVPVHDGPVPERRARSEERKRIVKASPAVRTLAAKMGVELDDVKATGDGGRVTREDVQAAAGSAASGESRGAEQVAEQVVTRVEFGRTRKVMYKALGEQAKVPHFGYSHTLDLTNLLPYLRDSPPSTAKPAYLASDIPSNLSHDPLESFARPKKPVLLSFLVKAAVMALEEHPILRSRVKESGGDRWLEISRYGTIGVAVSDPKFGLLTPSLPPLSPLTSLSAVAGHLQHLRETASRPSPPPHLTISSVGGLGEARGAMPVLPPGGGLAICAVGRAKWEVEWKAAEGKAFGKSPEEVAGGGLRAVLRIPVGWSADHRVLEGAELIAFTETWRKFIEEPWRWLEPE